MTFEEFKAEAERLGLEAFDDPDGNEGPEWVIHKKSRVLVRYDCVCEGFVAHHDGACAAALAHAARLLRPGVATELRTWLETEQKEMFSMFERLDARDPAMAAAWNTRAHDMRRVLAKLDELEGGG